MTSKAAGVPDEKLEPAARIRWHQVRAWRLRRHHLDERAPLEEMLDVVSDICGVHAQLMSSAQQAIAARVEGLTPDALDRVLWTDRSLVKTWALRGTLHLLPASEYPLWQAFLSGYRHYLKGAWLRSFGFTREELERTLNAVGQALAGAMLTREELAEQVAELTGFDELRDRLQDSWGATLKPAAFRGLLCHGPAEGQNVRFTHPRRWLGDWEEIDGDLAAREVTRRYLSAYGPATREHYGRWAGLRPPEAGRRIDALGEEVVVVDVHGTRMWILAEHLPAIEAAALSGNVRLLSRFDPYIVGAPRDGPGIVPDELKDRVYRAAGWISAVVLVDGRVAGVWEHERSESHLQVTIESFVDLLGWVRDGIGVEAERLAQSLDVGLDLRWS